MSIKHNCKQNDNRIEIHSKDGVFNELYFGTSLRSEGMIVIAISDLKEALAKCGLQIFREVKIGEKNILTWDTKEK